MATVIRIGDGLVGTESKSVESVEKLQVFKASLKVSGGPEDASRANSTAIRSRKVSKKGNKRKIRRVDVRWQL